MWGSFRIATGRESFTAMSARPPSVHVRAGVASIVALVAMALLYRTYLLDPLNKSDFGVAWFGGQALLHGANPYLLVGPGHVYEWPWNVLYPATSMVAAIPFAWLQERTASLAFIGISAWVLAWLVTREGWHRLPLFLSAAFVVAAQSGQWSPLFTAIWCARALALLVSLKPNIGMALLVSIASREFLKYAVFGTAILLGISLILMPDWPLYWLASLGARTEMTPRLLGKGGFLILLALFRWRRPEARLIVALALIPQTPNWYEVLPLHLVPATYRQSLVYSFVSSLGYVVTWLLVRDDQPGTYFDVGSMMVAFAYLPAVWIVLRQPDRGGAAERASLEASTRSDILESWGR